MDNLQREAHKRYSTAIAEVDALPPTPFKVTQLDPANNPAHKELFYSRVDLQVVAELIQPRIKQFLMIRIVGGI